MGVAEVMVIGMDQSTMYVKVASVLFDCALSICCYFQLVFIKNAFPCTQHTSVNGSFNVQTNDSTVHTQWFSEYSVVFLQCMVLNMLLEHMNTQQVVYLKLNLGSALDLSLESQFSLGQHIWTPFRLENSWSYNLQTTAVILIT